MVSLDKSSTVGKVLQVLIGLVLTLLMYILAKIIMHTDSFSHERSTTPKKTKVEIIDGFADSSALANISFNTLLPYLSNYLPLDPSMNLKGGAQFTYSLWLSVASPDDPSLFGKCIFMRGDKHKYNLTIKDNVTSEKKNITDYFTYCPMLSFGNNKLDFTVKFNNVNRYDESLYAAKIESDSGAYRKNILSIIQTNWMLLTIIFEDNIPINDFENGIRVQLFLNDLLYDTSYYKGMLKQNSGNLFFFPDGALNGVRIADMAYFNHALAPDDVKRLYQKRPSNKASTSVSNAQMGSMNVDLSSGNILDIYNT